jgi:hypothetical protein
METKSTCFIQTVRTAKDDQEGGGRVVMSRYERWSEAELKKELTHRGLKTTGAREVLVARLEATDSAAKEQNVIGSDFIAKHINDEAWGRMCKVGLSCAAPGPAEAMFASFFHH